MGLGEKLEPEKRRFWMNRGFCGFSGALRRGVFPAEILLWTARRFSGRGPLSVQVYAKGRYKLANDAAHFVLSVRYGLFGVGFVWGGGFGGERWRFLNCGVLIIISIRVMC